MIEITAGDGHVFSAYRADPSDAPKGAVLVLHEVFGVTPYIRKVVDALAAHGFVAIAPCLFDRVKKGVELGYDDAAINEGLELIKQIPREQSLIDIQATVNSVIAAGKIGVLGYDWGAFLAFHAANRVGGLVCSVGYYGCGITDERGVKRRIPTMLHFGTQDAVIPFNLVSGFRASSPNITVHDYIAGHGFACDDRDTFNAEAATKAWERTLTMFIHKLEGPPTVALKNAGAYAAAKVEKKKKPVTDDMEPPM